MNSPLDINSLLKEHKISRGDFDSIIDDFATRAGRIPLRAAISSDNLMRDSGEKGAINKYVVKPSTPSYAVRSLLGGAGGFVAGNLIGAVTNPQGEFLKGNSGLVGALVGAGIGAGSVVRRRQNMVKALQILRKYNLLRPDRLVYAKQVIYGDGNE